MAVSIIIMEISNIENSVDNIRIIWNNRMTPLTRFLASMIFAEPKSLQPIEI